MAKAVIEDREALEEFLANQPLIRWAAKKTQDIASGKVELNKGIVQPVEKKKDDNADLLAALGSMA
jgi:hypothetical protein